MPSRTSLRVLTLLFLLKDGIYALLFRLRRSLQLYNNLVGNTHDRLSCLINKAGIRANLIRALGFGNLDPLMRAQNGESRVPLSLESANIAQRLLLQALPAVVPPARLPS